MHHYTDYQNELNACQQDPSGSGCGTILAMYSDKSQPLSLPDADNLSGVIANTNSQTGQGDVVTVIHILLMRQKDPATEERT
jgi:hypothetical protein